MAAGVAAYFIFAALNLPINENGDAALTSVILWVAIGYLCVIVLADNELSGILAVLDEIGFLSERVEPAFFAKCGEQHDFLI